MKITCKRCRFWERMEETARFGICHRHAPAPGPKPAGEPVPSVWPVTFRDDWCGDAEQSAKKPRLAAGAAAIADLEEMAS